jgi:Methyltransferase domain
VGVLSPVADAAIEGFIAALRGGAWQRLVLARPVARDEKSARVTVRPIVLRGAPAWSFVSHEPTRDLTHNLPPDEALAQVAGWLGTRYRNAHLQAGSEELQLVIGKRGTGHLTRHATAAPAREAAPTPHDRAKQRWVAQDRPWLTALGVTTAEHAVVPAMARKWKQINRFVEIVAGAVQRSKLAGAQRLRVVDFGAGKAYLTFAVHDWLTHTRHLTAEVTGVELRADLVEHGNRIVQALGLQGLRLAQGDVQQWPAAEMDVMIALHACDTATDHAIHLGLQAGAEVIVCSPCCHKQLRPQLLSPGPLRSVFQHGIHAEQQAEMLTDSLRALLLQAAGYDTQVFEFVSLEHTAKNKMILAVKREQPLTDAARAELLREVAELKRYFGVREQRLESLLGDGPAAASAASAAP